MRDLGKIVPTIGIQGDRVVVDFDGRFRISPDAHTTRCLAYRMLALADIIDPPKKEEPPKDPAPAATEEKA